LGLLAAAAALGLGLGACGDDDASADKSLDELNFSQASAQDAGLYGAKKVTSTEPSGTETTPSGPTAEGYTGFGSAGDESGAISFQAPNEWSDKRSGPVGPFQASAGAAPDIDEMLAGWSVPGVFVAVSKSLGAQIASAELPELALPKVFASVSPRAATAQDCDASVDTYLIGSDVADNVLDETLSDLVDFGLADGYSNCGGNGTAFVDFAGYSAAAQAFVYFQFTATSNADIEALARFLTSLQIDHARVPDPSSEQTSPELMVP
jgi:hypothetical protein